jgi:hypothetical protein
LDINNREHLFITGGGGGGSGRQINSPSAATPGRNNKDSRVGGSGGDGYIRIWRVYGPRPE